VSPTTSARSASAAAITDSNSAPSAANSRTISASGNSTPSSAAARMPETPAAVPLRGEPLAPGNEALAGGSALPEPQYHPSVRAWPRASLMRRTRVAILGSVQRSQACA
jgi:hypothetical protein